MGRSRVRTVAGVLLATSLGAVACSEGSSSGGSSSDDAPTQSEQGSSTGGDDASSSAYPSSGPPGDPDQTIDKADVDAAVEQFGPIAEDALERTGVPGVAVSVVYDDEVVMSEGFGVRELGTDERVGADTVFQLASVSKPLGSAVVASIVGDEVIDWDEPITEVDSSFELADPWVSEHVTFADMYAHRSGLPEHAGDILEDLGGDRQEVLEALRYFPLSPFRATYAYTNAGLTEAGVSAAEAAGSSWTEASEARLYEPLGMNRSSSSFEDYMEYSDRAIPHVRDDRGDWIVAPQQRDAQAQSPAGGASSTVNDMAQFARMQLGAGTFEDKQIVDEEALLATRTPHVTSGPPRSPSARSSFYGLGWNVSYDDHGRTRLGHSGAFVMGAATTIAMVPNEDLAVVVLTNGQPVGLDLALAETFVDLASEGEVSRDWVELYGEVIEATIYPEPEVDYTDPPADPAPPADRDAYLGDYENDIYGTLQIAEGSDGDLQLTVGPDDSTFTFKHYDGDTFWFMPTGGASIAENALHATGVVFEVPDGSEQAESVTVQWLEGESPGEGVGTFERS